MIRRLLQRYKQGIHPCMLFLLILVYYDLDTQAMYDGNHILNEYDRNPVEGNHIPIEQYPFQDLKTEFVDLNEEELTLLKYYLDYKNGNI